jgi:hypothetical protein
MKLIPLSFEYVSPSSYHWQLALHSYCLSIQSFLITFFFFARPKACNLRESADLVLLQMKVGASVVAFTNIHPSRRFTYPDLTFDLFCFCFCLGGLQSGIADRSLFHCPTSAFFIGTARLYLSCIFLFI